MQDALLKDALIYAKAIFDGDSSGHDYWHTERVYRTACSLAEKEDANPLIVGLAAILHDVDDIKLSPATHESLERAKYFMDTHQVGSDTQKAVCTAIRQVSFKGGRDSITPDTIEGRVVQDADRLDAIGAIGIARCFAYGGKAGRPIYDP